MSITINNTTINSRLTIIFDADVHRDENWNIIGNDGPASGSGNTESDVYIDNKAYLNVRSHTEVPSTVHALQCWNKGGTWSYELEHTNNDPNTIYSNQSDLPQWVTNVVIRCEAKDTWQTTYDNNVSDPLSSWTSGSTEENPQTQDNFNEDRDAANTAANTARTDYLAGHSITY
jgi:hypothetical protein